VSASEGEAEACGLHLVIVAVGHRECLLDRIQMAICILDPMQKRRQELAELLAGQGLVAIGIE